MRKLPPRPQLSDSLIKRLKTATSDIEAADPADQKELAAQKYKAARSAVWFMPVLAALRSVTGEGERCMCCSGSESAQVEHYRDKANFPKIALHWENLLWLCGICNQAKGIRFDPHLPPVNPLEENVWDFFFIDGFGNLCARWDIAANALNARAAETIEAYNLDRQALQEARYARLKEMRAFARDQIQLLQNNLVSPDQVQDRLLERYSSPLHPDVADYFLDGPGATESPFSDLLTAADL